MSREIAKTKYAEVREYITSKNKKEQEEEHMDRDVALNIGQQMRTAYHRSRNELTFLARSGQDDSAIMRINAELKRCFTVLYSRYGPDTLWKTKVDWIIKLCDLEGGLRKALGESENSSPDRSFESATSRADERGEWPAPTSEKTFDIQYRHARRLEDPLIIHQAEPEHRLYLLAFIHMNPPGAIGVAGGLHGHDARRTGYAVRLENGSTVYSVPQDSLLPLETFPDVDSKVVGLETFASLSQEACAEIRTE